MKRRILILLYALTALLCAALVLAGAKLTGLFSSALAFPFEPLAVLLGRLSRSGRVGNGLAFALWAAISLSPLLLLRNGGAEAVFGAILCPALAVGLWLLANPARLAQCFVLPDAAALPIERALVGGVLWSLIVACFLLRFLRRCRSGATSRLWRSLRLLLVLLGGLFLCSAFGPELNTLLQELDTLRAANTGAGTALLPSEINLILRWAAGAMACILNVWLVLSAIPLIDAAAQDRSAPEVPELAHRLSRRCVRVLEVVICTDVALNLAQLLLARFLRNVNATLLLPVSSLCFVLTMLLAARLVEENRLLRLDNDLMI